MSEKAWLSATRPQSSSSNHVTSSPSRSGASDRWPADAARAALSSARRPNRAQSGWAWPLTTGTTLPGSGRHARNLSRPSVTSGRSQARTITRSRWPRAVRARHPATRAHSGPCPLASSRTPGSPDRPGPTSRAGEATSDRRRPTRSAQDIPSMTMAALSRPMRRLAPPVSTRPATPGTGPEPTTSILSSSPEAASAAPPPSVPTPHHGAERRHADQHHHSRRPVVSEEPDAGDQEAESGDQRQKGDEHGAYEEHEADGADARPRCHLDLDPGVISGRRAVEAASPGTKLSGALQEHRRHRRYPNQRKDEPDQHEGGDTEPREHSPNPARLLARRRLDESEKEGHSPDHGRSGSASEPLSRMVVGICSDRVQGP